MLCSNNQKKPPNLKVESFYRFLLAAMCVWMSSGVGWVGFASGTFREPVDQKNRFRGQRNFKRTRVFSRSTPWESIWGVTACGHSNRELRIKSPASCCCPHRHFLENPWIQLLIPHKQVFYRPWRTVEPAWPICFGLMNFAFITFSFFVHNFFSSPSIGLGFQPEFRPLFGRILSQFRPNSGIFEAKVVFQNLLKRDLPSGLT